MIEVDNERGIVTTIFTHKFRWTEETFVSMIPVVEKRKDPELDTSIMGSDFRGFQLVNAKRITERPLYYIAIKKGLGRSLERQAMNFPNDEKDMGITWNHEFMVIPAELEII